MAHSEYMPPRMPWEEISQAYPTPIEYAPSRKKANGQPRESFLVIKKSQKILSIFQIKNPKAKSKAPVPKSFAIVRFFEAGIRSAASDHLRIYVIRPAVMNIIMANTT